MPLELLPLTEADLDELQRIKKAAFALTRFGEVLNPQSTPERYKAGYERDQKALRDPNTHCMKVVDTDTGKMVSCARWSIWTRERTQEEVDKDVIPIHPQPGSNVEGERDFFTYLNESRKMMGTKPFVVLQVLVTDPEHHRRGAGTMHLKWGLDKADELRLPAYLESSEFGKPLYERFGFKVVTEKTFDMANYGLRPGTETSWVMIRDPKPQSD